MTDPLPLGAGAEGTGAVLLELGLVAAALAVLARLALRSGFSPVPLYLVAGLVLGAVRPPALSAEIIDLGVQIGVVLLLLMLGLEYSGEELIENLRSGLPAGAVDIALNFTPGLIAGFALGWDWRAAIVLGGVTYISSSGIVAKVLTDLGRLGNRETPAVLSILVLEDLVMAFYLPLVAVLLTGAGVAAALGSVAIAVAAAALALFAAVRFHRVLSRVVSHASDEALLLTVLAIVLVVAGGAEALSVSAAVGAFLVGIALSEQVAHRAAQLVSPLRDVFSAVFFVFFGLQVDSSKLPGVAAVAAARAVATAATKLVTGRWAARRIGVGPRGRLRAGAALVARGEFSIVIAGLGVAAGVEAALGPLSAAYVIALAVAGPVLARFAERLHGPRWRHEPSSRA